MELYRGKIIKTGEWFTGAVICTGRKAYGLASDTLLPERPAYDRTAMAAGAEDHALMWNWAMAVHAGVKSVTGIYRAALPHIMKG